MENSDVGNAAEWHEAVFGDCRIDDFSDFRVRSIAELTSGPKRLVDELYFSGLDILRCYSGRFRFGFTDRGPIDLFPGEALLIYPRHKVTIDACEPDSRIVYGVFEGQDVEAYFDRIGFFDFAKGSTSAHYESIMELKAQLDRVRVTPAHRQVCFSFLTDILSSQVAEMRYSMGPLVFDAMRLIRKNLRKQVVRLETLCEQLNMSRSYLHRLFVRAGLPSPSEVIRSEQLHYAKFLLLTTQMTVAEVSQEAGFISVPHFVTFVKKRTGQSPGVLRKTLEHDRDTAVFQG